MSSYLLMVSFYQRYDAVQYTCEDLKEPDMLLCMTEIQNTTAGNVVDLREILLEYIFTHDGDYFVSPDAPIFYGSDKVERVGIRRNVMGELEVKVAQHLLDSIQDKDPAEGDLIIDVLNIY